jgi:glutathione S-transferase
MKLYFSPLACSLASRIAIHESGAPVTFIEVDRHTKLAAGGLDFRTVNPLGLVPALEVEPGLVLTENAAILQHLADRSPGARLAPADPPGRTRLWQWLSFIGTELHKSVYQPFIAASAPDGAKEYALGKAESRLRYLAAALDGREFLLDHFTVADAYLFAVLNWSQVAPVDLAPWPAITAYQQRVAARPAVARAFAEELALYRQQAAV